MKQFLTLLVILLVACSLKAQLPANYSLYMMNKMHWNPAYAGLDHSLSFTGIFRKQWVDLNGSPTTQNVNVHMPMYMTSGGIGLNLENDALGAQRLTTVTLAYNYQAVLGSGISILWGSRRNRAKDARWRTASHSGWNLRPERSGDLRSPGRYSSAGQRKCERTDLSCRCVFSIGKDRSRYFR